MLKRKTDPASPSGASSASDTVQQARTRARQRLIGAAVLLVIGIIGFPLVFESQPRPIPVDIPIEIPRKDNAPPLVMPAERVPTTPTHSVSGEESNRSDEAASATNAAREAHAGSVVEPAVKRADTVITESRSEAGREVTPPSVSAASVPATTTAQASIKAVSIEPARKPTPVDASIASLKASKDGSRALALLEGKPSVDARVATETKPMVDVKGAARGKPLGESKPVTETRPAAEIKSVAETTSVADTRPATADVSRFVVQVGAFADAGAARETRLKVEKLGMKTYTQVAETPSGSRIRVRVGPFGSHDEAERALAKARAAGLSAVLLTL